MIVGCTSPSASASFIYPLIGSPWDGSMSFLFLYAKYTRAAIHYYERCHGREIGDNVWRYQAVGVCTNAYVVREIMRERESAQSGLESGLLSYAHKTRNRSLMARK